ncbi:MAG: sensor histidine kinase [Candidatus Promineifilaceae bacterium]
MVNRPIHQYTNTPIIPSSPTMNHPSTATRRNAWERLGWIWSAIFYIALILPTLIALFDAEVSAIDRRWIIGLSVLSSLWHWFGIRLMYQQSSGPRPRSLYTILYLLVAIALWDGLVNRHPIFFFTIGGLFSQLFFLLPLSRAIPGSILFSALVAYENGVELAWNDLALWAFVFSSVVAVLVALWISAIIRQSSQRQELIEQLRQTQADLAAAERQAGVLQERQRLSHEIHDTLAQGFISIVMHLEAAEQALTTDPDRHLHHLHEARQTARDNIAQARRVVQDLRPEPLEEDPLPVAIQQTVQKWSDSCGIAAAAHITGAITSLHPEAEVTLLRATQEALANIRKHAQATQVTVTLSYMGDMVTLDVQDNGVGMNGSAAATDAGGYGLIAMRERVSQLQGSLLIESEPGEGTTLVIQLPIDRATT